MCHQQRVYVQQAYFGAMQFMYTPKKNGKREEKNILRISIKSSKSITGTTGYGTIKKCSGCDSRDVANVSI